MVSGCAEESGQFIAVVGGVWYSRAPVLNDATGRSETFQERRGTRGRRGRSFRAALCAPLSFSHWDREEWGFLRPLRPLAWPVRPFPLAGVGNWWGAAGAGCVPLASPVRPLCAPRAWERPGAAGCGAGARRGL
ncbi:adenosine 5'-phosphosulfate reductase [Streptomyces sp. NBRC 110611]|nr:adenosine 5'-phosphosulfate reductase [Streptomyces sp. NBRC 110611]